MAWPAGPRSYFTEMCSGSEAGPYLRLVDFVYHVTLGLRVIKKKKKPRSTLNTLNPRLSTLNPKHIEP